MINSVHHPKHYTSHPSGIECIQITEYFNFNLGNAIKYIWRCGEKDDAVQDLEKARWYIVREIKRLKKQRRVQKNIARKNVNKTTYIFGGEGGEDGKDWEGK